MIFNIIYPVLFSLIPIFIFYNKNIGEVRFKNVIPLIAVCTSTALVFYFIIYYLLSFFLTGKASLNLFALTGSIVFYTAILIYTPWYIWDRFVSKYAHQYIIKYIIYAFFAFLCVIIDIMPIIYSVLFFSIIALNIIYILSFKSMQTTQTQYDYINLNNIDNSDKPNIYHIILDAYTGQKGLQNLSDYDNSAFMKQLENLGFTLSNNVYSNYNYTAASMPSFFNMAYTDEYTPEEDKKSELYIKERQQYRYMRILKSKLILSLKSAGYTIGVSGEILFSDIIQNMCSSIIDKQSTQNSTIMRNSFLLNFLQMTIFGNLFMSKKSNENHAEYLYRMFNTAKNIPHMQEPFYYFYHFMAPHSPFCFNADGSINKEFAFLESVPAFSQKSLEAFLNHLSYINILTIDMLTSLIENIKKTNRKAVIILHGDHGHLLQEPSISRYNTILAVYKHGYNDDTKIFPDTMSLINIFPYLFNYIFHTNIPIKDDKFYYEDFKFNNYTGKDVTNIISKYLLEDK